MTLRQAQLCMIEAPCPANKKLGYLQVPPFVMAGESIIVDTRNSTFVKRVG